MKKPRRRRRARPGFKPRVVGSFAPDASAADLGVHTLIGGQVSCVPDALYPADAGLVARIRQEIDPQFRPLWVTNFWRSPGGAVVRVGHHMVARYVPHPYLFAPTIRHLMLPTFPHYGIHWRTPIVEAYLLDGITDEERDRGMLPRYEPFSDRHFQTLKASMWARNNKRQAERNAERDAAHLASKQARDKAAVREANYRHAHDGNRLRRDLGLADRVYVFRPKEAEP